MYGTVHLWAFPTLNSLSSYRASYNNSRIRIPNLAEEVDLPGPSFVSWCLQFGKFVQVWLRALNFQNGEWAVVILNTDTKPQTISLRFKDLGLTYIGYELRDVLNHKEIGHIGPYQVYNFTAPATGALMLYLYDSS